MKKTGKRKQSGEKIDRKKDDSENKKKPAVYLNFLAAQPTK